MLSKKARWVRAFPGVFFVLFFGMILFAKNGQNLLVVAKTDAQRSFIGIPDVGTIVVQNLIDDEFADLDVKFLNPDGTNFGQPITTTMDPVSLTVIPKPDSFEGSADLDILNSSIEYPPVYALNFELSDLGNDSYTSPRFLDSIGINAKSEALAYYIYLTPVKKNEDGWNTKFVVQNRVNFGATIVVDFLNQNGTIVASEILPLSTGESVSFDLKDINTIPSDWRGSVVLSADQPVAISNVREYNELLGLRAAFIGQPGGETSSYLAVPALFKDYNLQSSELCVQNVDSNASQVYVSYSDTIVVSETIQPNGLKCFDQRLEAHADNWIGNAVVTSVGAGPMLAMVSVTAYDGSSPVGRWAYSVPSQATITNDIAMPMILNDVDGISTEIYLNNPNSEATTVNEIFFSDTGCWVSFVDVISPNETKVITQDMLPDWIDFGMAYFVADNDIISVVNATNSKPLGDVDRHFGYEGVAGWTNLIPPPKDCNFKVYLPGILSGD